MTEQKINQKKRAFTFGQSKDNLIQKVDNNVFRRLYSSIMNDIFIKKKKLNDNIFYDFGDTKKIIEDEIAILSSEATEVIDLLREQQFGIKSGNWCDLNNIQRMESYHKDRQLIYQNIDETLVSQETKSLIYNFLTKPFSFCSTEQEVQFFVLNRKIVPNNSEALIILEVNYNKRTWCKMVGIVPHNIDKVKEHEIIELKGLTKEANRNKMKHMELEKCHEQIILEMRELAAKVAASESAVNNQTAKVATFTAVNDQTAKVARNK
jgi:hypothetical protein